jgi:hypothetical protein
MIMSKDLGAISEASAIAVASPTISTSQRPLPRWTVDGDGKQTSRPPTALETASAASSPAMRAISSRIPGNRLRCTNPKPLRRLQMNGAAACPLTEGKQPGRRKTLKTAQDLLPPGQAKRGETIVSPRQLSWRRKLTGGGVCARDRTGSSKIGVKGPLKAVGGLLSPCGYLEG